MITKIKNYTGRVIGYARVGSNEVIAMQSKPNKFTAMLNERKFMNDVPFDKYTPMEISLLLLLGFQYLEDKNLFSGYEKDVIGITEIKDCSFIKPEYYKVEI